MQARRGVGFGEHSVALGDEGPPRSHLRIGELRRSGGSLTIRPLSTPAKHLLSYYDEQ